jgi:hypothetical protein
MDTLTSLASFRATAYAAFSRRQDALFELCDTLLTTGPLPSLPLLARTLLSILPPLTLDEALEVSKIYASGSGPFADVHSTRNFPTKV